MNPSPSLSRLPTLPDGPLVVILRGLPGCGKTTLARALQRARPGTLDPASADALFTGTDGVYRFEPQRIGEAHAACFRDYIGQLQSAGSGALVLVDNTNLHAPEIAPYFLGAQAFGRWPLVLTVEAELELAFGRQIHGVPRTVFDRMAAALAAEEATFPPWWRDTHLRWRNDGER